MGHNHHGKHKGGCGFDFGSASADKYKKKRGLIHRIDDAIEYLDERIKYKEIMKTTKLLYPFANVMGIFFPVGKLKDGGTCEFATEKCLEKCCAIGLGDAEKIGFEVKEEVYKYFLEFTKEEIAMKIISELLESECKILAWFASGDCPSKLMEKISSIIYLLDVGGSVVQLIITRNRKLWTRCKVMSVSDRCRAIFTVENIQKLDSALYTGKDLYAVPDYELGTIDLYKITVDSIRHELGCGGATYEYHIKEKGIEKSHLKLDCKACWENKTGCFSPFSKIKK